MEKEGREGRYMRHEIIRRGRQTIKNNKEKESQREKENWGNGHRVKVPVHLISSRIQKIPRVLSCTFETFITYTTVQLQALTSQHLALYIWGLYQKYCRIFKHVVHIELGLSDEFLRSVPTYMGINGSNVAPQAIEKLHLITGTSHESKNGYLRTLANYLHGLVLQDLSEKIWFLFNSVCFLCFSLRGK